MTAYLKRMKVVENETSSTFTLTRRECFIINSIQENTHRILSMQSREIMFSSHDVDMINNEWWHWYTQILYPERFHDDNCSRGTEEMERNYSLLIIAKGSTYQFKCVFVRF